MKTKRKRIAVIGLGQFGKELAISFAPLCEVMAIDINQAVINRIADRVHGATVVDARDFTALSSVVNSDFDEAIVGLSENMEASILAVLHLKKIGIPRIRAKARNRDHAMILEAVGADDVIFPERDTARRLVSQVMNPNLLDHVPIGEDFAVMQISPPSSFLGQTLQTLDLRGRFGIFVIAMTDVGGDTTRFLPGPEAVIAAGTVLTVIGKPAGVDAMRRQSGGN